MFILIVDVVGSTLFGGHYSTKKAAKQQADVRGWKKYTLIEKQATVYAVTGPDEVADLIECFKGTFTTQAEAWKHKGPRDEVKKLSPETCVDLCKSPAATEPKTET
jgi:hypothetical protein